MERMIVQHLRTDVNGKKPLPRSIMNGELAINYAANGETLFIKNTEEAIAEFKDNKYYQKQLSEKADKTYVDNSIADLVDGAPETLDTLKELAAALNNNADIVDVLNQSISSKQDKLVSGTNIKTINGESIVGSGDMIIENSILPLTYSELVSLRDNSQLIPGQQYRITDYQCTTTQENTRSAGHIFDIIVTADDESTLNEEARAVKHDGDTYFDGCNLNAWKLWYCLDNDTNRFAWAIDGELIDTIKPTNGSSSETYTYSSSISKIVFNGKAYNLEIGVRTMIYSGPSVYITKTDDYTLVLEGVISYVNTLGGISVYTDSQKGKGVIYRMIDEFDNDVPYDFKNIQFKHPKDTTTYPYYYYTFANDSEENNTDNSISISNYCYSNTIREYISGNKRRLNCIIFIGYSCHNNSFGNSCYNNTFGTNHNSYCYSNTFGNNCRGNIFGDNCEDNIFGNIFQENTFGNICNSNTFGNDCSSNTFGNDCSYNTFGNDCASIKFASNSSASAKYGYYQYNHFGDGCQKIVFKGEETASSSAQVQNYRFAQGLQGTSSAYLTIDGKRNRAYETYISKDTDGTIKESVIAEKLDKVIEIRYNDLVTLRGSSKLVPGQQYRIIDYTCTTTQSGTKSAGHVFDIIVTADDESTLNEVARAIKHEGDAYFANNDLNAWQIWYCLDNDTTRFAWADATNGKGVIYRMIDEFNNDVPYDFKNIQFYRKWNENKQLWSTISSDNTGVPCYTFSSEGNSATTSFTDYSLASSNSVYSNVIKKNVSSYKQTLNNICFFGVGCHYNTFGNNCYSNTFGNSCGSNTFGNSFQYNTFGNDCDSNTFGNICNSNTFGNNCWNNTFGNDCYSNTFGNRCYGNTFGNSCYNNTFGNNCCYNTFGNYCYGNTFGTDCGSNTFGNSCYTNSFGNRCQNNTFGNSCNNNIFGNHCYWNTFGTDCGSNTFGNRCSRNTFGNDCYCIKFAANSSASIKYDYYRYNHLGDGCQYIVFTGAETASSSAQVQNYNFAQGLQGTDSAYLTIDGVRNRAYETKVAKDSNGEVKIYCEADLIL